MMSYSKRFVVLGALLCASTQGYAADLPSMKQPIFSAPAPSLSWTGFYVGGQVGYTRGRDVTKEYVTSTMTYLNLENGFTPYGVLGGVHAGGLYQYNNIVAGLEVDLDLTGIRGNFIDPPALPFNPGGIVTTRINTQGSVRGRLGYAFGPTLLYATGGFAVADYDCYYGNWLGINEKISKTMTGYTVGGGIEYMLTSAISARLEYRYTEFDMFRNDSAISFAGYSATQAPSFHSGRFALSYHF